MSLPKSVDVCINVQRMKGSWNEGDHKRITEGLPKAMGMARVRPTGSLKSRDGMVGPLASGGFNCVTLCY